MIYTGLDAAGGEHRLPAPVSARLCRDEDVPADSLEGSFPGWLDDFCGLRAYSAGGRLLFDGIVDEQIRRAGTDGRITEFAARSRAALLLDNEALPQIYGMPSLGILFQRHAAPYGFTRFLGKDGAVGASLTVKKGMSEWQVLSAFCTRFLGVNPRVTPGGVLDASGERPGETILLSDTGGTPCLELREENRLCELYSELWIKPARAQSYFCSAVDGAARAQGVCRRRLLDEGRDGERALEAARKRAYRITAVCPGEPPDLSGKAEIRQNGFLRKNLCVTAVDYRVSSAGERSRLTLRPDEN